MTFSVTYQSYNIHISAMFLTKRGLATFKGFSSSCLIRKCSTQSIYPSSCLIRKCSTQSIYRKSPYLLNDITKKLGCCHAGVLSDGSGQCIKEIDNYSCELQMANHCRQNFHPQVPVLQKNGVPTAVVITRYINMRQIVGRCCNNGIGAVKYLHLKVATLSNFEGRSSLSLTNLCNFLDESLEHSSKAKQQKNTKLMTSFCGQKSVDLNRTIPLLGYVLLSYMSAITFYREQPRIWSQRRYYSIKRNSYKFPELKPEDLEENFVRGSGPGGQSVNQTSNCVVLKHKPSGLVIKCHETRSLDENRKIARKRLEEKLDLLLNGDQSFISQQKSEVTEGKHEMKRRAKIRLALKKAFKERENLE